MADPRLRQIKIKTGIVRRWCKKVLTAFRTDQPYSDENSRSFWSGLFAALPAACPRDLGQNKKLHSAQYMPWSKGEQKERKREPSFFSLCSIQD
ncbi:tubulin-specific chaperone A isoform X2 [Ciconia boyciana]|uniref:tubulin-specific chaperone A isoform X2 n=1 Tax=Ciconia boyciana TaxID=52775 RepID=UPI003BA0CC12